MTVQATAQEPNVAPGSRPLSAREREEEVNNFLRGEQAPDTADTPAKKPTPVQGYWERLKQEVLRPAQEIGRSIPRGLANVGNEVVRFGAEVATAVANPILGGTHAERQARSEKAKGVQAVSKEDMDAVYGPRSDDLMASFTESIVQGVASMVLLRRAGLTNPIAAGAVTDAVAFNPYEAGLSELLARHGDNVPVAGKLLTEVGKLGTVGPTDGFAKARIKRTIEGSVAGGVLSLAFTAAKWGTKRLSAESVLANPAAKPAELEAAQATIKKADETIASIDDGTHTPKGARAIARPNGDGTWRVEGTAPETTLRDEIDLEGQKIARYVTPKGEAWVTYRQEGEVLDIINVGASAGENSLGISAVRAIRDDLSARTGAKHMKGWRVSGSSPKRNAAISVESPRFTRAEAETQAATMDHAIRQAEQPNGAHFSDADVKVHFETAERIKAAPSEQEAIDIVGSEDHFNLGAIASGEDFNAQLRALVANYKDAFSGAKKRPVVTQDATIKAAQDYARTIGITDWAARVAKAADDPARLALSVETVLKVAGVRQVGNRIAEIGAARVSRPHDPALMTEARRLLDLWHGLSLNAFEHRSELGRSLNILQALADKRATKVRFKTDAAAKAKAPSGDIPNKTPNGDTPKVAGLASQMSDEEVDTMTRLFQRSGGEPRHLHAVVKAMEVGMRQATEREAGKTGFARVADWINTVYINALISGAKTAQSIFYSGAAMNALEATSRILAGTVTLNRGLAQEGAAYWYAMARYAKENIKGAAAAFREGTSVLEGSAPMYVKSGVTGSLVTVPGRIAGSIDEFTRITAYRAEEFAKSLRAAQQNGLTWSDAVKQAEADVKASIDAQTGIAMNPVALEKAGIPTLSSPLGNDTFMGKISSAIAASPFGKLIIPFMRPSVNTFRYVWQNTPVLNLFNKQAREIIMAGGEEAAVLHARSAIAGSMTVYAYTKFAQGDITGDGPSDPTLRKVWLKNHQPYSLRVGDSWISYRRMEPFASWLGMVADASEAAHEVDNDGDRQSVVSAVFSALLKNSYNKSWTQGLSQFLETLDSDDTNAIGRWSRGLVSGFVPNALAQFNDDPYLREARTVVDAMRAKVPGLSKDLPAKFNLVGEPVMKQGSMWNRNFSTATTRSAAPSLLEDTLLENNIGLQSYPSKIARGQIDLLDERWMKNDKLPYIRLMEIIRENGLRKELESEIKSDSFKKASGGTPTFPGGEREARLKVIKDTAEEKSLAQLLREYDSTGLKLAYKGAQYVVPNMARYKGPDKEAVAREKYGVPVPQ